ncbi:GntR family transcriptional regulator [Streptomyces smyrnaeus]|uniref:GntR family transcriptional regulator n=2 Tax=Actinomycetes TaxID=1760 RepID=UPI0036A03C00
MAADNQAREVKFRRIAGDLRRAIRGGEYAPGDRIPGENALMAEYGVARMTARQALGVLVDEGLTEPRKGKGVFVRDVRPTVRRVVQRLSREQWGAGRSVWESETEGRDLVVDQIQVSETELPESAAEALGLQAGEPACVRDRRYVLDGKPVTVARSYLPLALVAGSPVMQQDTGPGGVYARLAELGHTPTCFSEQITCRMATPEESCRLKLPTASPVIESRRTAFSETGRAVEVNHMIMDAASYVLQFDFDA